jgi:hypothetical protein
MNGYQSTYIYRNGDRLIVDFIAGQKQGKAKVIYYGGVEGTKYFKNDVEIF